MVTVVHNSQPAQAMGGNRLMVDHEGSMREDCVRKTVELTRERISSAALDPRMSFGSLT